MDHAEHIHATDSTDRRQVDILFALPAFNDWNSPVIGEFPSQGPEARSFDAFLEQTVKPNSRNAVIWDAIALIITSLYWRVYLDELEPFLSRSPLSLFHSRFSWYS